MLRIFMIIDAILVATVGVFSMIPSKQCCPTSSTTDSFTWSTNADGPDCSDGSRLYKSYQIAGIIFAILKAISSTILVRFVCNRKRGKRIEANRVKEEWVFFGRFASTALMLPPLAIVLAHYVTKILPEEKKELRYDESCVNQSIVSWSMTGILCAIMAILFAVEVIVFVFCQRCYIYGRKSPVSAKQTSVNEGGASMLAASKMSQSQTQKTGPGK